MTNGTELNWTLKTVLIAGAAAGTGLLVAVALKEMNVWPFGDYSEVLFGGLCGATVVHRIHPLRPLIVLLVFIPVMSVLLLLARVLFYLYVLGKPLEL
jgi:hypothetical protein